MYVAGIVTEDLAVTAEPFGGVPDAVAVFVINPAFRSACVVM
jgi:hypothetical protein